jgi:DNA mismatch endonuclease, patch repair protein
MFVIRLTVGGLNVVDRFSAEKRSWLMSRVRRKDTTPELAVRRLLFGLGYRYRVHRKGLPGTPDIVFLKRKKAVFVHGCFWHGHSGCKLATRPKSSIAFWTKKISGNQARDSNNVTQLSQQGWTVLIVWQCEIQDELLLREKLVRFLGPPRVASN